MHTEAAFPFPAHFTPSRRRNRLSAASLEDLLAMKLGYRAKYIKRPARTHAADGWIFPILNPCPTKTPWTISPAFTALAMKVANCILPFRPPPHRRLPCGHMDPEDPHEPVRPQKPSSKRSSPVQGLRGSDTETFFPVPRLCRSHAAVYFLL